MEKYRFFWCDAPSPLHEVMEPANKTAREMNSKCLELVKRVGGNGYAGTPGNMGGVTFEGEPPAGDIQWKCVARTKEGNYYYWPKRNTKAGKKLYAEMRELKAPSVTEAIARASGMNIMQCSGRYMLSTTAGFKDGRIFIRVPNCGESSGDKFPKVPSYLKECKGWEMERWFDVGRNEEAA